MSRYDWLEDFLLGLADTRVDLYTINAYAGSPRARTMPVDSADWGMLAKVASQTGCRWCGVWGDHIGDHIQVNCLLEQKGGYLLLRTQIPVGEPVIPSHAPWFHAADRMERQLQDMLGLAFLDHPDERRWLRHQAWRENDYPLRRDFPREGVAPQAPTPPDSDYAFRKAQGPAVYEIPVGPVHAGVIEPGHFRFQAVGEYILQLEQHLGYVHKGVEKIAVGRDAFGLNRLASRVSGDTTVAHSWAACLAMENALGVALGPRAVALRAILAERERIANHLGDIGAICNDVGFAFTHMQCGRLREDWQRQNQRYFGHRLLMDVVVPGGISHDLAAEHETDMLASLEPLKTEVERLLDIIEGTPSLVDRLASTGYITPATAAEWGGLGYVGRASGHDHDVRRDAPYFPYADLNLRVPVSSKGDVATRLRIRAEEILVSLDLLQQLLANIPRSGVLTPWPEKHTACEGLGIIEGWRGEIISYVRLDEQGKVQRFFPRDPSWFNWPLLEHAVLGNIVPDFPVCNKSVNGSYSGHDL